MSNIKSELRAATLNRYLHIMQLYANGTNFPELSKQLKIPLRTLDGIPPRLCKYYKATHITNLVAVLMRKNIIK